MRKVLKLTFCWNRRGKISRLDLYGDTCNIYPLYIRLSGTLGKRGEASYWRHGNNTFPENMNYNTQC